MRSVGLVLPVVAAAACTAASGALNVQPAIADPPWFSGAVRPGAKGVDAPVPVHVVPAIYPASAAASHASGEVWLDVRVEKDGRVSDTRIAISSQPFDGAAETAVQRWRFSPARRGRTAVAAIVRVKISFVGGAPEVEPDTEPEWFTGAVRPSEAGVQPPKVIKEVRPAGNNWCDSFIARPTEDVWLDVRVETNGRVSRTRIVQSLSIPGRAAVAHEAARQWEFVPAFLDGRPTPAIVRMKLSFADGECVVDF
jgi:TonB family protein